jgi:hypothetical protein
LHCRQLCVPRRGHGLDECQDAAASAVDRGRFAIADGASESAQSALWARLLVDSFVADAGSDLAWADWLPPLQQRWSRAVEPGLLGLPWFLEPGWHQGAFATLLGLELRPGGLGWTWEALAVGDSCLCQVRDGRLMQAFPVQQASDFDGAPWLIGSRFPAPPRCQRCRGEAQPQDRLWLMTDALAQWFLRRAEAGDRPWEPLEAALRDPDADRQFGEWIEQLRRSRQLRDDDVTLMVVSGEW